MRDTESDRVPFPICTLLPCDDVPLVPVLNRRQREALRDSEAARLLRSALEPRAGRPLSDEEVGEVADNLRRLGELLEGWEVEDRERKGERARRGGDPQP